MFLKTTILPFFAGLLMTGAGLLVIGAGLLVTGCSSNKGSSSHVDLLTATPWKYEEAGFGSGDDGSFNALDPRIAGSVKDYTIIFLKDGTGYSQTVSKNKLPFIWSFQNNDSTIYFQDQYYKVRMLTRHRLEIYADQKLGENNTRYTIVLSR